MLFLDAIGVPYYLMLGGTALIMLLATAGVIALTLIIFALFQRYSDKNKKKEEKDS